MDLGFLQPLYESHAPVASVHLDTSRDTTDAGKEIELRWRHLRKDLSASGADDATLDVLEEAVREGTSRAFGQHGHALFASEGRLLGVHTLAAPPRQDRATWMPVADALPVAVDRDRHLPYVLVALDRVNAKVTAYPAHPTAGPVDEHESSGNTMHKIDGLGRSAGPGPRSRLGGRSDAHHAAQEVWRENTAKVAQHVRDAVAAVNAAVIFAGGDEEAITHLRENLGERKLSIPIKVVPGGRGGPDAEERLHQAAEKALYEIVVESHNEFLADYQQKLAHERAVRGTEPIARMLSESRVQTLLLGAEREDEPQLWGSVSEPVLVSADPARLDDPDAAFRAPASALMLRSAVMSGSEFTELLENGEPSSGSGAVLRFTE